MKLRGPSRSSSLRIRLWPRPVRRSKPDKEAGAGMSALQASNVACLIHEAQMLFFDLGAVAYPAQGGRCFEPDFGKVGLYLKKQLDALEEMMGQQAASSVRTG